MGYLVFLVIAQCDFTSVLDSLPDWPIATNIIEFADSVNGLGDDLCTLSDSFDDPSTLANWQRVYQVEQWPEDQLETWDIDFSQPGHMTMMPYASSWYEDLRGVLAFKEVGGDFVVSTRFRITNRAGTWAPGELYSLGGIFIRAPRNITPLTWTAGGENYIFLSAGAANDPGWFQHEVKTTVDSNSVLDITYVCTNQPNNVCPNIPTFELIGARLEGEHFILMRRTPEGEWVIHRRYHRNDLPATLQVGLTTYTDWETVDALYWPEDQFGHNNTVITTGNPDLIAEFDEITYRRPQIPAEHQGKDFSAIYNPLDPSTISDEELLDFLAP